MAKCRNKSCDNEFVQWSTLQRLCPPCMISKGRKIENKIERKAHKAAKDKVKSKSKRLDEAETAFRRWVRVKERLYYLRQGKPPECISCETTKPDIQYCAGHLKTKGGFPELRFDEENCHLQCNRNCNMGLSGNIKGNKTSIGYEVGMVKRYGKEKAEEILTRLSGPNPLKNYTSEDIDEMKKRYNRMANELEKELAAYMDEP